MGIDVSGRLVRRRATRIVVLCWVALLSGACGGTATPTGSAAPGTANPGSTSNAPVSPSPASTLGDLSWIFEAPSDPIDVRVTVEVDRRVEAVISVDGGSVSATGSNGTVYQLDIPKDALPADTTIGLTPVAELDGMPFGSEPTYAVQLSPDGLFLDDVAVLTITPAEAIPLGEELMFGYREDGQDVSLARPVVDSSEIKIRVSHFSGNGVTRGTLADIEPLRRELGGDVEERLERAVNEQFLRNRAAALLGQQQGDFPDFETAFEAFEEQVLGPRLAAAGESCAAGRLALETAFNLERQRQILGESQGRSPLEDYPDLASNTARLCMLEEFELCVEDNVIHRIARIWRTYEHQSALGMTIDPAVLREGRELTITCLTFVLKFESTGTGEIADYGYESTVTSTIELRFNPDQDKISGDATLVNEEFEFRSPCGGTSTPGDGTFSVGNLKIIAEGPEAVNQEVKLRLSYLPGATSERATIKICGSTGSLPLPEFGGWTDAFLVTHQDELLQAGEVEGGFIAEDWEVFGDEYFAKKEWIKERGDFVEVGTFKLYHTPTTPRA